MRYSKFLYLLHAQREKGEEGDDKIVIKIQLLSHFNTFIGELEKRQLLECPLFDINFFLLFFFYFLREEGAETNSRNARENDQKGEKKFIM